MNNKIHTVSQNNRLRTVAPQALKWTGTLTMLVLSAALMLTCSTAHAGNIYRWVGSNGVTSYGSVPPKNVTGVHEVYGTAQAESPSSSTGATYPHPHVPHSRKHEKSVAVQKLSAELHLARQQWLLAAKDYQQGMAIRTGNEHNYARYLQRINILKQDVRVAQLRMDVLQHSLTLAKQKK